jgi:hypothetical protein
MMTIMTIIMIMITIIIDQLPHAKIADLAE